MLLSIDDLHAGGIEFVTYDVISGGAFQVILCTERIGEISILFVWGSGVHKLYSLSRTQQNGVKRVGSTLANGVQSTGIGRSVDKNKVILCLCIRMRRNVIPARGEESGGSRFHHMVPVTKDVHMQALRKV